MLRNAIHTEMFEWSEKSLKIYLKITGNGWGLVAGRDEVRVAWIGIIVVGGWVHGVCCTNSIYGCLKFS